MPAGPERDFQHQPRVCDYICRDVRRLVRRPSTWTGRQPIRLIGVLSEYECSERRHVSGPTAFCRVFSSSVRFRDEPPATRKITLQQWRGPTKFQRQLHRGNAHIRNERRHVSGFATSSTMMVPAPTAGNATITNTLAAPSAFIRYNGTAGNATVTNNGRRTHFRRKRAMQSGGPSPPLCTEVPACIATAATATIVNNSGGIDDLP